MARADLDVDYHALYELLVDKNIEHQTFEVICSTIQKKFAKADFLRVGTLLMLLLRQGDFPGVVQRISTYYLLLELFRSDGQTESPFLSFLVAQFDAKDAATAKVNVIERNFLGQLLSAGTKELSKQTPQQVMQAEHFPGSQDIFNARQQALEKEKELPASVRAGVPNIIAAPTTEGESSIRELLERLTTADSPLKSRLAPKFMTLAPPLLPCDDELVWFDATNPAWHRPIYDITMCSSTNLCWEVKRLLAQAYKQALTIPDQQRLSSALERDPNIVYHIGLTPTQLPNLVEFNPMVAIEILLKLMNSTQITEYFSVLVNMELSLHSMEVVNRLTNSVDLPSEFVHLYISNCISTCETIKDKYMQSRLVRLVCVFLQSLIRNRIINVKELSLEVEAFCVEFGRIREAAGLFRLLKQMEVCDTQAPLGARASPPQPSSPKE
ncbi:CCR4-NOT transcription complex subunit 11 [Phlebotomus argentipes]|uniref:CCR4-NOT transcription complex subunit 11 n=1 Tax=Phlebotomus argentipes TaxID=94469 RepID=UPI002892B308|nr:CCR4-NOT transcription complex subunit 11 [Phlebotomus argentipes]